MHKTRIMQNAECRNNIKTKIQNAEKYVETRSIESKMKNVETQKNAECKMQNFSPLHVKSTLSSM